MPCRVRHERQSVTHLILDLVVGQVVERAQDQRFEHKHRIHRLAPGARLALGIRLALNPLKHWPEFLPRHDGGDLNQWVTLGIKARVAV